MGPYTVCVGTAMKSCVIALAFVAIVFSAPTVEDDISPHFEMEMVQDETAANLNNMVAELKKEGKAKAYAHDFNASKRAIAAALKSLNDDLDAGHNHDKAALETSKNDNTNAINTAHSKNKASVKSVRGKACPTKRAEEAADAAKKKAKGDMDSIYNKKICGISTTWRDMDNERDKTRAKYVAAKSKHDAAVKAHQDAVNKNKA